MPIRFTITQHDDCWSFESDEHGQHMGYPDALQASAAAMRAFERGEEPRVMTVEEIRDLLRPGFTAVAFRNNSFLKHFAGE